MNKPTMRIGERGGLMLWYFIAGFISGVVGMIMLGKHIYEKRRQQNDERSSNHP